MNLEKTAYLNSKAIIKSIDYAKRSVLLYFPDHEFYLWAPTEDVTSNYEAVKSDDVLVNASNYALEYCSEQEYEDTYEGYQQKIRDFARAFIDSAALHYPDKTA